MTDDYAHPIHWKGVKIRHTSLCLVGKHSLLVVLFSKVLIGPCAMLIQGSSTTLSASNSPLSPSLIPYEDLVVDCSSLKAKVRV